MRWVLDEVIGKVTDPKAFNSAMTHAHCQKLPGLPRREQGPSQAPECKIAMKVALASGFSFMTAPGTPSIPQSHRGKRGMLRDRSASGGSSTPFSPLKDLRLFFFSHVAIQSRRTNNSGQPRQPHPSRISPRPQPRNPARRTAGNNRDSMTGTAPCSYATFRNLSVFYERMGDFV